MNQSIASRRQGLVRRSLFVLVGVTAIELAFAATTVRADDINPPPWRGLPLTTVAQWEFLNPNIGTPDGPIPTVVGDGGGTPYYATTGELNWDPVFDGSWIGGDHGGHLNFYIPNWIDEEPWKWLQVQITYRPDPEYPTFPPYVTQLTANDPMGISGINQVSATNILINPTDNLWHRTELWQIFPNPNSEQFLIAIFPDVVVAQVVVDSWSVPEPGTMSLAGLGAIMLGYRAWRRRKR